jgi:hypothetical protein
MSDRPPLRLAGLDNWIEREPPDLPSAPQPPTVVETYRGFAILADPYGDADESGPCYGWEHGDAGTVEQVRADIDDWYSDPENPT